MPAVVYRSSAVRRFNSLLCFTIASILSCSALMTMFAEARADQRAPDRQTCKPAAQVDVPHPTPTGNIGHMNIATALGPIRSTSPQWWYYMGVLAETPGAPSSETSVHSKLMHTFQFYIVRQNALTLRPRARNAEKRQELGVALFGFGISRDRYFWNVYPETPLTPLKSAGWFENESDFATDPARFGIRLDPIGVDSGFHFAARYTGPGPQAAQQSIFEGRVGEPFAQYSLTGSGTGYIIETGMNYNETGTTPDTCRYNINVSVQDERGVVSEGLGGYVGGRYGGMHATLADGLDEAPQEESWEVAQPRLRVLDWSVSLTECSNPADEQTFEGADDRGGDFGAGMIYNDIQSFIPGSVDTENLELAIRTLVKTIRGETKSGTSDTSRGGRARPRPRVSRRDRALVSVLRSSTGLGRGRWAGASSQDPRQNSLMQARADGDPNSFLKDNNETNLYIGTWNVVSFMSGPYAGCSAVFVAFWDKDKTKDKTTDPSIADSDVDSNAPIGGFAGLFIGMRGDTTPVDAGMHFDPKAAFTVADRLEFGADGQPLRLPYRIEQGGPDKTSRTVSAVSNRVYSLETAITVRGGSQMRYALAGYAARRGHADDAGADMTIRLQALSTGSENVVFVPENGFFESGAVAIDDAGDVVGLGVMEQMGNSFERDLVSR